MNRIIILGGGKIGAAIVELLGSSGDYELIVADRDASMLGLLHRHDIARETLDVEDAEALRLLLTRGDAVISALPFFLNIRVADIASIYRDWSAKGAHFLTEPKDHGREIRAYVRDPDGHLIEVGQTTGLLS